MALGWRSPLGTFSLWDAGGGGLVRSVDPREGRVGVLFSRCYTWAVPRSCASSLAHLF